MLKTIMNELAALGTPQTKKTLMRHGVPEPLFGVRIGDTKKTLVNQVKGNQQLAHALFATGNYDAQYLAGLAVDPHQLTKAELHEWAERSSCSAINEAIVASLAAESTYAQALANEWLATDSLSLQNTGWSCYSKYVSLAKDETLDLLEVELLLAKVLATIHQADNDLRYTMNQFIISVGTYCLPLRNRALDVAHQVGAVTVIRENVTCSVPSAIEKLTTLTDTNKFVKKKRRAIC